MTTIAWVISCEHASSCIPAYLKRLFDDPQVLKRLQSHEGYDKGALMYAKLLSQRLRAPLFAGRYSRLLVELNRSLHHQKLFSSITSLLTPHEKEIILTKFYHPFRQKVLQHILGILERDSNIHIFHLSCHTFTPVLDGHTRNTKLGILYDPRSKQEQNIASFLKQQMMPIIGRNRLHLNRPYKGVSDGHVTYLRTILPSERYSGLELEISSDLFDMPQVEITRHVWISRLIDSLKLYKKEFEYRLDL